MVRPAAYLAPLALLFVAGALVMQFFVILSAVTHTTPLSHTYFLQADTSGIAGARPSSQWSYLYVCGAGNTGCSPARPAPALGAQAWSSGGDGAPDGTVGRYGGHTTSETYYYLWRFGWVFYLIALFFAAATLLAGCVACFGRLGAALAGLVCAAALLFQLLASALMTAAFVRLRGAFHRDGRAAHLGAYGFGFSWGATAALLIATVLFFLGLRGGHHQGGYGGRRSASRHGGGAPAAAGPSTWDRHRSVRSQRSQRSYDMNGSRGVKEEYV
ncbi:SUR7/PalI family-domain-containing protein [Xylariaceae sp. FL0804]|nr:SUR7/PalI family-domain-containing protein [Xylariaceae sp. FL0804]